MAYLFYYDHTMGQDKGQKLCDKTKLKFSWSYVEDKANKHVFMV